MADAPLLLLNSERTWRGGENQLLLLARGLARRGRPAITVCQPGSPLAQALAGDGLQRIELAVRGGFDLVAAWRLRRLVRRLRPVALHAHAPNAHALALRAVPGTGVPVLVTRRVDFPVRAGRWRKYGPRVRHFAAVSQAIADVLVAGGVERERVTVIRSGVDPAPFGPGPRSLRAELGLPDGALLASCVAQLVDHKDHRTLLAAWARVEAALPAAHLALAGDGELEGSLREQMRSLGLGRVHLLGFRRDIPAVLRSSDLFVLASHLEGLGTSVADAMLCGLPVVATRAGGIPEQVADGATGRLVPVRDAGALAAALIALLDPAAAAERERLGAAGRLRAQRELTAERMVDGYCALYRRLLGWGGCDG